MPSSVWLSVLMRLNCFTLYVHCRYCTFVSVSSPFFSSIIKIFGTTTHHPYIYRNIEHSLYVTKVLDAEDTTMENKK